MRLEIDNATFLELYTFCVDHHGEDPVIDKMGKLLQAKVQRIKEHEAYSSSKTASTEEEREKARKEYLDLKGIDESFRW